MICAATAFGMSLAGLGSSSDICVTASGVPMVKALWVVSDHYQNSKEEDK